MRTSGTLSRSQLDNASAENCLQPERPQRKAWFARLSQLVRQSPLIETRLSKRGLSAGFPDNPLDSPPEAVFMGLGLCTPAKLSHGLPMDTLGMLLPAEQIRRAVGATRLILLVADEHAHYNGFSATAIEERSHEILRLLARVKERLGLQALSATRASQLRRRASFREIQAEIDRHTPADVHPYFKAELADVTWMARRWPRLIKVGWTINASARAPHRRDEVAFDNRYRRWCQPAVSFVYCKAGRKLDDRAPKGSPYVATDLARRICLRPGEDVTTKLARARNRVSLDTWRGARKHLKAIARAYADCVRPLKGTVEMRLQTIIDDLYVPTARGALEPP